MKNLFDGITFIIVSDLHPINHFFRDLIFLWLAVLLILLLLFWR